MSKTIRNMNGLQKAFETVCSDAVQAACLSLLGYLQEIIDSEYYDVFEPSYYVRTNQFWESAVTKMLNKNCGKIFMDETEMNYNSFWTGERQLYEANRGSHGGWVTDETKEHKFWEAFEKFCEENAVNILKEELKKRGLPVK